MKMSAFKAWLILFGLQILVALTVFSGFISGRNYFAYLDIGSDSYAQFVPYAMNMARAMIREGFTGWSFEIGLGSQTTWMMGDTFTLLSQIQGPDGVLPLRIWVYLLKILLGGASFFLLIRCYVTRWETAVISALAYSFCGFIVINGQWDPEATVFIFYPLILWAMTIHLRHGNVIALPLVLAAALISSVFFVSIGVFLLFACGAFIVTSTEPRRVFKSCLTKGLPLSAIGYLLAAPYLFPVILQILDSSRVSGGQSLFDQIVQQSLSINDWPLILAEIGGIFHKDIFGIGSAYQGYWNYLEGPGFFIGVLLFLIIPQLWNGRTFERRALLISLLAISAYFLFPVFRYAAMGFAAPYFRVSTLWISLILLILAAKAIDQVLEKGVNAKLLAISAGAYGLLLITVAFGSKSDDIWTPHVFKILWLALLATTILLLAQRKILSARLLPAALLCVVFVEAVLISRPSYTEGRSLVSPELHAYHDGTPEALQAIRDNDKGTFRIEKTYDSVSLADSLAQDYMGIKSYFFHNRGVVDFNVGLGLIAPTSSSANFTNWLPNAGPRFMLNSLLGVKYLIAKDAVPWPGFITVSEQPNFKIYRNEMALPLGIVQNKQVTQTDFFRLSALPPAEANVRRDVAIINAVVVDKIIPEHGGIYELDDLLQAKEMLLQEKYFDPVQALQKSGLQIQRFSSNHITGIISPTGAGILVFSIPFNQGWSLRIDGKDTPMMRANFGMLAAPVPAGKQSVELRFETPGQRIGWLLGAFGVGLLWLVLARYRRR
jgi:uncharacterized membrane protein YfhO